MVRVPLRVAWELEQLADQQGTSLSDVAGRLIAVGLTLEGPVARERG